MKARTGSFMLTLLTAILLIAPPLQAQIPQTNDYQVLILHPPALGFSRAFRINESGEVVGEGAINGNLAALIWTGAGTNFRSLNPGVGFFSNANDIAGTRVVGTVLTSTDPNTFRATLWDAHTSARTELHPATLRSSVALGVDGDQAVGWGAGEPTSFAQNALLWPNLTTPVAFVNLNPGHLNFIFSEATAVDAAQGQQVGRGERDLDLVIDGNNIIHTLKMHALLWSGSAASAIDLHPLGFDESQAFAVSGLQQAGFGKPAGSTSDHALLWRGSAGSVVDLHPAGFTESGVNGMRGTRQVGGARGPSTGDEFHAMLWRGTAASAVDLHAFLPVATAPDGMTTTPIFRNSGAIGVDSHGNIVGRAETMAGVEQAILWQRLPDLRTIAFADAFANGGTTPSIRNNRLLVTLDGPTPSDASVTLASSHPTITNLPRVGPNAGAVIPSGVTEIIRGVTFNPVATRTLVMITATFRGQTRFATIVVVPPTLSAARFGAANVTGGTNTSATVTLDSPAPSGGVVVTLSGSTTTASWPSSVTVPAGATSVTFPVQTRPTSAAFLTTLTARYAGVTRTANLTVIRWIPEPIPGGLR